MVVGGDGEWQPVRRAAAIAPSKIEAETNFDDPNFVVKVVNDPPTTQGTRWGSPEAGSLALVSESKWPHSGDPSRKHAFLLEFRGDKPEGKALK